MKFKTHFTEEEFFNVFFRKLWREKILFLYISIVCSLLLYLFSNYRLEQNDKQKIDFWIANPPDHLFVAYEKLNLKYSLENLNIKFSRIFKKNLLMPNNLASFVEKSNEFKDFVEFLKSENITILQYFQNNRLQNVNKKNKNIENNYFLFFPKKLDGSTFLINYIKFTQKNSTTELKKYLKLIIEDEIKMHHDALKLAKVIGLKDFVQFEKNSEIKIADLKDNLYYHGSEVLSQKIIFLETFLRQFENEEFNYNIISEGPTVIKAQPPSLLYILSSGLLIGLFISFIIIFFKNILNNKEI